MTAEVICYRAPLGRARRGQGLGLSLDRVDALAKSSIWGGGGDRQAADLARAGLDPDTPARRAARGARRARSSAFPRHLSQHVGGLVITRGRLCELVPIENAAMPDRTVIEWDKDDLDALGILKVDCLALGMLTRHSQDASI